MTRRQLLALGLTVSGLRAQSRGDNVGAARDLVYQALELLSEHADAQQVRTAVRILRGALDQQPGFGDAFYYRYLCLKRLNENPAQQNRDLEAARLYDSEALRDGRDPFKLAVPKIYESLPLVGQKWALVVGISRFDPNLGAEPLTSAANDAIAFADLLRDPNVGRFPQSQVFRLVNEEATTAAIKARLNFIAKRAKPEDIVIAYVATHGSSRSRDIRQVSYLYTYDTNVSGKDDLSNGDEIFATALPMVEVSSIISTRCVAQRTVAIFDTCHSGAGASEQTLSQGDLDRLREGAGRYILSSCQANEISYEDNGHGYFTASLIENLRARQGCIRLNDLFEQVRKEVSAKAITQRHGPQTPVLAKSDRSAEIVLGVAVGGASETCLAS